MESEDDGFAKQGGEALDIGEDFDSEDADEMPEASNDAMRQPMKPSIAQAAQSNPGAATKAPAAGEVKGNKVEDQPFDLAVDVNDSEEIDSDEEEDEVNVDVNVQSQAAKKQQQS